MKGLFLSVIFSLAIIASPRMINAATSIMPSAQNSNVINTTDPIKEFLLLTPKKYEELTGKKMTLTQKLSLKFSKVKIKRDLKRGKQVDLADAKVTSGFSFGGFVLGALLSVVGVFIAYLIGNRNIIKWSWIGFGVSAAIILVLLLI